MLANGVVLSAHPQTLVLFHVNDVHGHVEGLARPGGSTRATGGVAALQKLLNQRKTKALRQGRRWLFLSAGDLFRGTPIADDTQGKSVIALFNDLRLTASCLGNHEFDYGPEALLARSREAAFAFLGTNLESTEAFPVGRARDVRLRLGPVTIGLLGVTTPDAMTSNVPVLMKPFLISPPGGLVGNQASELRQRGASLVLLLSHLGTAEDCALARHCPDLDVIIGGHTHQLLETPIRVGRTTVVQAGSNLSHLGELVLTQQTPTQGWTVLEYHLWPLANISGPAESSTGHIVEQYASPIRQALDEVIETLRDHIPKAPPNRYCPATGLVAQAMRAASGSEIAIFYSRGTRCGLTAGPVTVRALREMVPFGNTLVTMDLQGATLLQLLEEGVRGPWRQVTTPSSIALLRGDHSKGAKTSWEPEGQSSRVLQCAGLSYHFDPRQPEGSRVSRVLVHDTPLELHRSYSVVTNSFLAAGGDGYKGFESGTAVTWLTQKDYDAVVSFARSGGLSAVLNSPTVIDSADGP